MFSSGAYVWNWDKAILSLEQWQPRVVHFDWEKIEADTCPGLLQPEPTKPPLAILVHGKFVWSLEILGLN